MTKSISELKYKRIPIFIFLCEIFDMKCLQKTNQIVILETRYNSVKKQKMIFSQKVF